MRPASPEILRKFVDGVECRKCGVLLMEGDPDCSCKEEYWDVVLYVYARPELQKVKVYYGTLNDLAYMLESDLDNKG